MRTTGQLIVQVLMMQMQEWMVQVRIVLGANGASTNSVCEDGGSAVDAGAYGAGVDVEVTDSRWIEVNMGGWCRCG